MTMVEKLAELGACYGSRYHASHYKSQQAAWDACGQWRWLAWLILRVHGQKGPNKLTTRLYNAIQPSGWTFDDWNRQLGNSQEPQYIVYEGCHVDSSYAYAVADAIRAAFPKPPRMPR